MCNFLQDEEDDEDFGPEDEDDDEDELGEEEEEAEGIFIASHGTKIFQFSLVLQMHALACNKEHKGEICNMTSSR